MRVAIVTEWFICSFGRVPRFHGAADQDLAQVTP
jgi:hypothetical protein